ncbi:hypothetical protein KC968_00270 [Candidatus Saccharibacteria bacterium]|nr:hypothetical protein [Candidatus Saccharibacteria bacterium]
MVEMIQTYKKAEAKVKHSVLRYSVIATSALAAVVLKEVPGSRDRLPEPLDISDHAGNINISLQLGYASGLAAGEIYSRFVEASEPKEAARKTRAVMALAGFCVGLAANTATETKFGLSVVPGAYGTPDATDLFYGVAASTFAAATGPSIRGVDMSHFTNVDYIAPERLEELQAQGAEIKDY